MHPLTHTIKQQTFRVYPKGMYMKKKEKDWIISTLLSINIIIT